MKNKFQPQSRKTLELVTLTDSNKRAITKKLREEKPGHTFTIVYSVSHTIPMTEEQTSEKVLLLTCTSHVDQSVVHLGCQLSEIQ